MLASQLGVEFQALLDVSPDAVLVVDGAGTILEANARAAEVFRIAGPELVGRLVERLVPERVRQRHVALREAFVAAPAVRLMGRRPGLTALRGDGTEFPVEISLTPVPAGDGSLTIAIVRDISDRVRMEEAVRTAKEKAEVTLASIADGVATTDGAGAVEYLNPVAEELTGWATAEARGRPLGDVLHARDAATGEALAVIDLAAGVARSEPTATVVRRDGSEFAVDLSAAPIGGGPGRPSGWVVILRDVTTQRRLALQLAHEASHDPLTGLVNRAELERRVGRALEGAAHDRAQHAFCYIDLDRFKVVNDMCGHGAGDELLRRVSEVLRDHIRQRDTLARIGGDEFGLLLEHCPPGQARRIASDLRRAVAGFPFEWRHRTFRIGASIGLVQLTGQLGTVEDVFRIADSACYLAKARGRNQVRLARPDDVLHRPPGESDGLARLRAALREDGFRLLVQPIRPTRRAGTGASAHWEVLVRLRDRLGRNVLPRAFLPIAERYGLSWDVDAWVLRHAARALGAWHAAHPHRAVPGLSINLSAAAVADRRLVPLARRLLRRWGLPASSLSFEITEAAAAADLSHARRTLLRLHRLGCGVALDQCGEGLAAIDQLRDLPLDYLKISGRVVRGADREPVPRVLLGAINEVGRLMGSRCVAACVETGATLRRVREAGIALAQGYAVGRPVPLAEALPAGSEAGR
jgi:diguanylate cyclase (GGDEF)-like protein/PAS domain S-box-containing protein